MFFLSGKKNLNSCFLIALLGSRAVASGFLNGLDVPLPLLVTKPGPKHFDIPGMVFFHRDLLQLQNPVIFTA